MMFSEFFFLLKGNLLTATHVAHDFICFVILILIFRFYSKSRPMAKTNFEEAVLSSLTGFALKQTAELI